MAKGIILISILIATIALPLAAARTPSAQRGLKRLIVALFLFVALYIALLLNVYVPLSRAFIEQIQ